MSCLYLKIIVVAIWQHWADKVTFCSFFIFRSLFLRYLHDFLHSLQTNVINTINYSHFYKNNTKFLVLEKLPKNFKITFFWEILAQTNTPNSVEQCGRKEQVAHFFSSNKVLNNVIFAYKSSKCKFFLGGEEARIAEKQVCKLATLDIDSLLFLGYQNDTSTFT